MVAEECVRARAVHAPVVAMKDPVPMKAIALKYDQLHDEAVERARSSAPRTRLRVVAVNSGVVSDPMLVCQPCRAWTRHDLAGVEMTANNGVTIGCTYQIWRCRVCASRRVWGAY